MNKFDAMKKVVDALGGPTKAAAQLRVKQPSVSAWLAKRNGMSAIVAIRAQNLTGVPAKLLCPEVEDLIPAA